MATGESMRDNPFCRIDPFWRIELALELGIIEPSLAESIRQPICTATNSEENELMCICHDALNMGRDPRPIGLLVTPVKIILLLFALSSSAMEDLAIMATDMSW